MKKRKQILVTGLAFILLSTGTSNAFAERSQNYNVKGNVIAPLWEQNSKMSTSITFNGKRAYCEADIRAESKTTRIEAEIILEKNEGGSYKEIRSWSTSSNSRRLKAIKIESVTSGSYRLRVIAKIYEGSDYYTISESTTASY